MQKNGVAPARSGTFAVLGGFCFVTRLFVVLPVRTTYMHRWCGYVTPHPKQKEAFFKFRKNGSVSRLCSLDISRQAGGVGACGMYGTTNGGSRTIPGIVPLTTWNCPAYNNVHTLNTPNVLLSCLWFFVCSLDYGASSSWSRKCGPAYSVVTSTCPTRKSREIKIHNTIGWIGAYTSKCGGFCGLLYGGVSPYRLVWALT